MIAYTLQSYKDETGTDLIDTVLDGYSYKDKCAKSIWAEYRYDVINCCGTESAVSRWIQRCKDIAYQLDERYSQLFSAYEQLKTDNKVTDITITDKSTTTTESETSQSDTSTTKTTSTGESIPPYSDASKGTWLDNRDTTDGTGTNEGKGTAKGTSTTERDSTYGMIPLELFKRMKDGLFNPYYEYAREYSKMFVQFWADEC